MAFKCKIGLHSWVGCKCSDCGKLRDEQHDWSIDCEMCSICGKINENQHDWSKDCDKCCKCGKSRENHHNWSKDCEKCSKCGKTRDNQHSWSGCKCSNCDKTRDEQHDWIKDCEKCSNCGKTRISQHKWTNNKCSECGSLFHIETVNIGSQFWTKNNLNVSVFSNGDPITEAKTDEQWSKAGEDKIPAWCNYDNDPSNGEKYGKLYNWYAVNDPRGLSPEGWKVPSDKEWTGLIDHIGGYGIAASKIKSVDLWEDNGNGTNESGFSGLPGGMRGYNGFFNSLGETGNWWSSSESDEANGLCHELDSLSKYVQRNRSLKGCGFSIRCVSKETVENKLDIGKSGVMVQESGATYYNRGIGKLNARYFEGAIEDFSRAIEIDPKDAESYFLRGKCKSSLEDYEGALSDYDIVYKSDPKYQSDPVFGNELSFVLEHLDGWVEKKDTENKYTYKCDNCSKESTDSGGYAFYSDVPMMGNMLFCKTCTDQIITEYSFAAPRKYSGSFDLFSLKGNQLNEINAEAIIARCKKFGFTPVQAKQKAKELGLEFHKDNKHGQDLIYEFWRSK